MSLEKQARENYNDDICYGLANFITEEYALTHDLNGNTAEVRVYIEMADNNGQEWIGERIIKIKMKKS